MQSETGPKGPRCRWAGGSGGRSPSGCGAVPEPMALWPYYRLGPGPKGPTALGAQAQRRLGPKGPEPSGQWSLVQGPGVNGLLVPSPRGLGPRGFGPLVPGCKRPGPKVLWSHGPRAPGPGGPGRPALRLSGPGALGPPWALGPGGCRQAADFWGGSPPRRSQQRGLLAPWNNSSPGRAGRGRGDVEDGTVPGSRRTSDRLRFLCQEVGTLPR